MPRARRFYLRSLAHLVWVAALGWELRAAWADLTTTWSER